MSWLESFYEQVSLILIVLYKVLCLEISNLASKLKFNPEIGDDHPVVGHMTANLWFGSIELTVISSNSSARGPINDRRNVAESEKQLESMAYRLSQERGRRLFRTPRMENVTEKNKRGRNSLNKENRGVLARPTRALQEEGFDGGPSANGTSIAGFWREHAKGDLRTRRSFEISRFFSPCWEKKYMDEIFYAGNTIVLSICAKSLEHVDQHVVSFISGVCFPDT